MKKILLASVLGFAALFGCGDPAASVPLAPDKPPLDGSKMTPEQLERLHQEESVGGSGHTSPAPASSGNG